MRDGRFQLLMVEVHREVVNKCCRLVVLQVFEYVSFRLLQSGMVNFNKGEFGFEIEAVDTAIVAGTQENELVDAIDADGFQRHDIDEPCSGQAAGQGARKAGIKELTDNEVKSGYGGKIGNEAERGWQEMFGIWVIEKIASLAG